MRPTTPLRSAAMVVAISILHSCASFCSLAEESLSLTREEANLCGVTFIDADRGWAVGQHGTILHTQDGGVTWKPQASGSRATLTHVAMYNSQRGLAIGGRTQRYTQLSLGEVLVTMNGGMTWQVVDDHDLPNLRHLIIGAKGKCIAIGDWSPVHLSAVFTSSDGGLHWQPQTCEIVGSAVGLAGNVDDYLVLSEQGEVVRIRSDAAPQKILAANDDWRMLAGNDTRRMLIGPRGAIVSNDRGDSWQVLHQGEDIPLSIQSSHSGATTWLKNDLWMTSEPSNTILSFDSERIRKVPQPADAPLRGLFRLDADRGWAVGDFGAILATRDGGSTWRTVRGGGKSAAVMAIASRAASLPWSLLATDSLQHQKRTAVIIDRDAKFIDATEREQLRDATSSLGPCITLTNTRTGDRTAEILATCKPAVLLLEQGLPQEVKARWTSHALEAGVKRVLEFGERGSQTFHVAAAIPSAGILASDVWFDAISVSQPSYLPPSRLMLSTRFDMAGDSIAGDGLANCTGGDPRYAWSRQGTASRRQMQVLQARTAEMTWIESLINSSRTVEEFQSQLTSVMPRMDEADRQRVFARLVSIAGSRGRSDLYLAALESFTQSMEDASQSQNDASLALHSLARLRLDGLRASVEWRHTFGSSALQANRSNGLLTQVDPNASAVDLAVHLSPFQTLPTPPIGMTPSSLQAGTEFGEKQAKALGIQLVGGTSDSKEEPKANAKALRTVDLRWEFHPAVLMTSQMIELANNMSSPSAATLPSSNEADGNDVTGANEPALVSLNEGPSSAATNLKRLARLTSAGTWGSLATQTPLPESLVGSQATDQPYLDGRFDEPWWRNGQAFVSGNDSIKVQVAHDPKFVYVAIDAPLLRVEKAASKDRQRDTPLDAVDRYRLKFDLDRDLMTAFEFEFDGNGNTRDSCDGFLPYHPKWFIACVEIDGRLKAELAIQKSDFGDGKFEPQSIWNFSAERLSGTKVDRGLMLPAADRWRPLIWE